MIQWAEKDFEDWLCGPEHEGGPGRLWAIMRDAGLPIVDNAHASRQVRTGVGIADLVITGDSRIVVVELKAHTGDGNDAMQALAYAAWFQQAANDLGGWGAVTVDAILVAPSFTDRLKIASDVIPNLYLAEVSVTWSASVVVPELGDVCPEGRADDLINHWFGIECEAAEEYRKAHPDPVDPFETVTVEELTELSEETDG